MGRGGHRATSRVLEELSLAADQFIQYSIIQIAHFVAVEPFGHHPVTPEKSGPVHDGGESISADQRSNAGQTWSQLRSQRIKCDTTWHCDP